MWECGKCGNLSEEPLAVCESCGTGPLVEIGKPLMVKAQLKNEVEVAEDVQQSDPGRISIKVKPPVPPKHSLLHRFGVAYFVKLPILIMLFVVVYQCETSSNQTAVVTAVPSSADTVVPIPVRPAVCGSEDVKCFADKARSDALIPCKHSIESRARYDYEWTDSLFGKPLFEFDYMWGIPPNVVVYYGSALKAQNGFGAWKEMYYQCWYNVRTSQIERVVLR
ncbi:hypothetical protein [Aeromonas veronii]|uniref:hypothetical protein n=1 Tax=Aeromonas veronii TaxID=654 RepID=UPI001D064AB5|nr:hypothetical protein [Aeromonas veronii]